MAKAAVIAHVFGSGNGLDSYILAFLIPSFLADVFCGSIVPAAVPEFVGLRQNDPFGSQTFYANIFVDSLKLSCCISAACLVGALLAQLLLPSVNLASKMLLVMIPIIP
jgi:peptidoglycan biosynthesis protein MviN/MurJ (putative lipid II flippase)